MGSEWKEYRLDEVTDLIIDCPHSTPTWTETGIIVLRNQNIRFGKLDITSPSYTNMEGYLSRIKRAKPTEGDIVLTREAPMGEVCQIPKDLECCLGQRMVLLRANKKLMNPDYLLYTLQSPYLKHQISWNEGTGTTVSNIRIPNIKSFKLLIPNVHIQNKIAHILSSLDNKITLNRQINQTLEQMAQALFSSWFVNFDPVIDNALEAGNPIPAPLQARAEARQIVRARQDFTPLPEDIRELFPSEFEESELGWIPKGWRVKDMTELLDTVSITYPLKTVDEVIFLNTGDIEFGKFLHRKYSPVERLPGQAKKTIKKGDILFSEIRPQNKRFAYVNFDATDYVVSTKLMVLRAKNQIEPLLPYFILTMDKNTKELQRIAELRSGTFPQITYKELTMISCVLPSNNGVMEQYIKQYLKPYYIRIFLLISEIEQLSKLRDTLLPKLISGELRVPVDVE